MLKSSECQARVQGPTGTTANGISVYWGLQGTGRMQSRWALQRWTCRDLHCSLQVKAAADNPSEN